MCGIIGYVGELDATEVILDGLKRLEYRGYDSAGLAVLDGSGILVRRSPGKIGNLEARLRQEPAAGSTGLGHTRWATHGRPSEANAHPHADCTGGLVVVHNGIIENYAEIKARLLADGHTFRSETDTEVIAHLLEGRLRSGLDLREACRAALAELRGAYAVAVLSRAHPHEIVAAKLGAGSVVVGLGTGEAYLASDIPAILPYTRDVVILEDGELARVTRTGAELMTRDGRRVERAPTRIDWDAAMAQKGGYRHFMLKEIHEQPRAVADSLRGRLFVDGSVVSLPEARLDAGVSNRLERVIVVACGTSYHAALVGRFMVERMAGLPAEVDVASEFRYRDLVLDHRTLVIAISQSGETADTLGAVRAARARQAPVLAITNVVGSAIARESSGVVYTQAGPEIGVASTKTFTTTIAACYLVALALGEQRGYLSGADARKRAEEILEAPRLIEDALTVDREVAALAQDLVRYPNVLYLGRGLHYPLALEGALKLKEISYIHAEGYAAGEMKHGPIALIDENMPVVALVPRDATYERMMGNLQEVRARDGRVIAICHPGDHEVGRIAAATVTMPAAPDLIAPMVSAVPLQLLAYHVAALRGLDVDQPRNLAKSVTVE
ncbi:MAG TPA: glutamine--fructose-6-phosphate transaminase (isomerizing) [Methylomirabilota bacterium]|nr:glutamine--fructose-6-phosphate transaminase (isomerizing) [Methylomirabilota bacterium]